ncbi:uncharacterized protein LOC127741104 [Arachis duranensis]|uniref:Uncharacterized protein LOC107477490 n=2 Tax=Arachis TaxID=3817 RepID=A0A6P4CP49_ARADU|nr:uncharacterized protein LOC107477490 [Arachis duranensis]XP_015953023.1 uncharacterized protein LOC107477490 [Arachis duranensis]XP_015953029.1 uncharacterized protein LOC107477490 [Arachis duranensis]XP_015953035.1 uncharacterized protein LOC107477490 [Arachis duranensis]XP_025693376.1 uncharacterized protein LOC112795583 [Arachis hypogaea]XP_025693392.1 uncharacterized protein LOC112795583 [Arachis hypogaea]XP_025693401.1 uncharacterized protein LOC112795583 [Arachis hypogaea]XP_0256934
MEGIKIKNGEELIKVGTTGTISSLMMKELDQNSAAPNQQIPSSLSKPQQLSTSVAAGNPGKQLQPRKSLDEASSSGSSGIASKTRLNGRHNRHRIPMLNSDGFPAERTSIKHRNNKKRSNIVEVVDIKCGHPNKAWGNPISNSLKKLGFSKLSESIV